MALFVHKDTVSCIRARSIDRASGQRVEREGIEGWFSLKAEEILGAEAQTPRKCRHLDVWFDSGTTHVAFWRR
jgi:isoleucyl-tRNA synthetase